MLYNVNGSNCWYRRILEFYSYLKQIIKKRDINCIAEELNEDAIKLWKAKDSAARIIANQLGIAHKFCDPDTNTRNKLGIKTFNEIQAEEGKHQDQDTYQ